MRVRYQPNQHRLRLCMRICGRAVGCGGLETDFILFCVSSSILTPVGTIGASLVSSRDEQCARRSLGVEATPSRGLAAGLSQERLRHLDVFGHAEAAVDLDGFGEELAGLLAVAGAVAVEEHAGVEAAGLRLFDDVGQFLGPA